MDKRYRKGDLTGSGIWCVSAVLGAGSFITEVFDTWFEARQRFREILRKTPKVEVWEM